MARQWPGQWTPLDEVYGPKEWTLQAAQDVSQAERMYSIWLHWHEARVMIADAQHGLRNWCPLCPESWADTVDRFQVRPERRPFVDEAEALAHLTAWIRQRSLGRWLMSPQMTQELHLQAQSRLIRGDPHSTVGRLIERLREKSPAGLRFCGHTRERELSLYTPIPLFLPWWCVSSHYSADPCPMCAMNVPVWSSQTIQSDSLPEDADALDNRRLWEIVHAVHKFGVHRFNPDDIDCPDCQRLAAWRDDHPPLEPLPTDIAAF
jgi:hypothetical protein